MRALKAVCIVAVLLVVVVVGAILYVDNHAPVALQLLDRETPTLPVVVWLYAAHNPQLKAGIAWYGRVVGDATELSPQQPIDLAAGLHAPVLGLYGGADSGIPLDGVERMRAALQAADAPANQSQIIVYPDTPHGFHADYRPSYRKDQATDGWNRLQAWLMDAFREAE